jgi:RHS repeat-associated protein
MVVEDTYSYDGYGVMLSDINGAEAASNADTSLLYAGEQYDGSADMYYNRARYYDPSNGRFNRTDPYAGNTQDPQSLHKYLYCHANPINGIDPTGMMNFSYVGQLVVTCIQAILTSISTYATAAYMWAATHMALVTAFTFYAMWTFILSSLWVGMEEAGTVPEVSLVGDITVAKGLQIISGAAFFLGLLVMGSVPDLERGKLTQQVQTRAYELRKSYSPETHKRITMAVGIAENKGGERVTLIATSENTRQGLYTRPGVTLKANEIMVSGTGHAEERIVKFCQQTNLRLMTITATRDVCEPVCVPVITPTGADIVAPISDKDLSIK